MGYQTPQQPGPQRPQPRQPDTRQLQSGPRGYYYGNEPSKERIITVDEINKFHRDVAQGRYVGREKEKAEFDAAMIRAANEGRIKR